MNRLALVIRTHRFETAVLGLFALVGCAIAVAMIVKLRAFGIPVQCFTGATGCEASADSVQDYVNLAGWTVIPLVELVALAIIPSVILGLALGAKEIDRGTTAFVWSLTTSRRRWFIERAGPAAVAILVVGLVAGFLAGQVEAVRYPLVNAGESFEGFGTRGLALAGTGLAVFGLTLLGGSVIGRLLPALIAAAVLSLAALVGVNLASENLLRTETVLSRPLNGAYIEFGSPVAIDPTGSTVLPAPEPRFVDDRVVVPDGEVLTVQEANDRYGGVWMVDDPSTLGPGDLPPGAVPMREIAVVNPGEIYPLADARLGLLFGVVGLVAIVLSFAVIDRRRP